MGKFRRGRWACRLGCRLAVGPCAGEVLIYAGTALSGAGVYNINNTIGLGCDTIFAVTLSYLPAVVRLIDTAIVEGQSLLIADTVLTTAGVYEFIYPQPDGCDSLLRIVLDIISSNQEPDARSASYRITNPIRQLSDFRVFTTAGDPVPFSELSLFTIDGRAIGTWPRSADLPARSLPAGVYVYRLRVEEDRIVGRVVVF